jgi:microcystin-dependent protein
LLKNEIFLCICVSFIFSLYLIGANKNHILYAQLFTIKERNRFYILTRLEEMTMTQKRDSNKRRAFFKTFLATLAGTLALKASKLLAQSQNSTLAVNPTPASISTGTIGQITMFAGNFAPAGWAFCQGQILPISSYDALFSILGTTYGGDGRTTFALPDLRGRVPISAGQGPGLSNRNLGSKGGEETTSLKTSQMPSHTHNISNSATIKCSASAGTSSDPQNGFPARNAADIPHYTTSGSKYMAADNVEVTSTAGTSGQGQSHNTMQPFLTINYIICINGDYPSRS